MGRLRRAPERLSQLPESITRPGSPQDPRSLQAEAYRRLYKSPEWTALRRFVLRRDLWTCQRTGVLLRPGRSHPHSAVVHHKTPHRGDRALFLDPENCEAVSKGWHDVHGQAEDSSA